MGHVVEYLLEQPDIDIIKQVGYILRTTAVYGNGKFGIADFELLQYNTDFSQPFRAQMYALYVLKMFSIEWVEHIAKHKNKKKSI